jgi:hypothetical protein
VEHVQLVDLTQQLVLQLLQLPVILDIYYHLETVILLVLQTLQLVVMHQQLQLVIMDSIYLLENVYHVQEMLLLAHHILLFQPVILVIH